MNSDEEVDIMCSDNLDNTNSTDHVKQLEDIKDERVKLLRQGILMSEILSEPMCKKRHQRR